MIVGALAALPGGVVTSTPAAAAQPDWWPEEYDYPEVPSNDLPQASGPAGDEESAPAPVTDLPADVPQDAEGSATVDESWSRVPGTPVSVASGDSVESDEPAPDDGSADDDSLPLLPNLPGLPQDDALEETPEEGATDPAPGDGAEQSQDETVPGGTEVQVEVLRPDDLAQGVTLIAVTAPESAVQPAPGDGGDGSEPDDGSTDPVPTDPALPSDLPMPSESPAPGELDESGSGARSPPGQAAALPDESTTAPEPTEEPAAVPSEDPSDESTAPAPSEIPTEAPTEEPTAEPSEEPVDAPGVGIRLSYEQFKNLFGGGWSDRLEVRAYPACYSTTPELPECATSVPVPSVNNGPAWMLEFVTASPEDMATLEERAADAEGQTAGDARASSEFSSASTSAASAEDTDGGASVVYAVAAEAKQFSATPFKTSSEWQVGAGTGEFTYSYPVELPAPVGGSAPELSLNYFSGSVDDLATSQASEVGVGWADLTPGFITRSFASCDEDERVTENSGPNEFVDRGDQCWMTRGNPNGVTANPQPPPEKVEEMYLTLNGRSSRLTKVGESPQSGGLREEFRLVDDPGWQIIRRSENTLGGPPFADSLRDDNRERWIVRTPEGTEYWFGGRSGPTSGEGSAESSQATLVMPVFGNHVDEDCHVPGNMVDSWCPQAWRWNLDRVIDPVGNEIHYSYEAAVNRYDRYNGPSGSPQAAAAQQRYHRSSTLTRIEYGFRTSADNPRQVGGPARQVVELETVPRCFEAIGNPQTTACGENKGIVDETNSDDLGNWPDTPLDQICKGATCNNNAPAFFSTRRLHRIVTYTQQGNAGSLTKRRVASYVMGHLMPDPAGAPRQIPTGEPTQNGTTYIDLWLDFVEKTGHVADDPGETPGNTAEVLDKVAFDGHAFFSRVVAKSEERGGQLPKWRIFAVRNELGGRIDIDYDENTPRSRSEWGTRPCTAAYVSGRDRWASDRDCFALSDPESTFESPSFDWYHRYLVVRVALSDDTVGTRYDSPFDTAGPTPPAAKPAPNPGQVQVTEYEYQGAPAWRYTQSLNVPLRRESWTDWRGYGRALTKSLIVRDQVPVKDRPNPPAVVNESITQITRFRGMDGSRATTNQADRVTANVTTTDGGVEPDSRWLNGKVAETRLARGDGGPIERSYTEYGVINTLQERELQPFNARYVYSRRTLRTVQLRNQAGNPSGTRQHEVITTVNNGGTGRRDVRLGAVEAVWDRGDLATTSDDKCALTRYRSQQTPDPTASGQDEQLNEWIRRPYLDTLHSGSCTNAAIDDANQVRRTETFYDDAEDRADPTGDTVSITRGQPTRTVTATGPGNGKTAGVDANGVRGGDDSIVIDSDYDNFGRPTVSTDPNGNATRTVYNGDSFGAAGDVLTRMRVTQEQDEPKPDLTTTTIMEPQAGLPVRMIQPNGETTNVSYDGLGRTRKVWLPNQPRVGANGTENRPSSEYAYIIRLRGSRGDNSTDEPSRITTATLRAGGENGAASGTVDTTNAFYDGWGRTIQTEAKAPVPGEATTQRIVVSTSYDHRGMSWKQTGAYSAGNPNPQDPKIVNPNLEPSFGTVTIPRFTTTTYDAVQRPIAMDERTGAQRFRITRMAHLGNATITDQPGPGQARSDFDVWDRPTSAILAADPPTDANGNPTAPPATIDSTTHAYNTRGELETMTKTLPGSQAGTTRTSVWDYDYDWASRKTAALDPDTGLTLTEYDPAGNLTATSTYTGRAESGEPEGLDARITTTYDQLNRPLARYDATSAPDGGTPANPGLELARWTYDTRPGRTAPGQPADTTPLACNDPAKYVLAADDPLMLGRLASVTTTVRTEGDNAGLAAPIGAESPWKITQDTCGYDANGNTRAAFTTYPTWLTGETANVDANNDGTLEAVAHGWRSEYNKRDMPTLRNWTSMPGQSSFSVNYSYLNDNHLNAITQGAGTSGQTLAEAAYTPIGQTSRMVSYNAVRDSSGQANPSATLDRTYTWEPASERLSTVVGTQASTNNSNRIQRLGLLYEYDLADNPTRITNGVQSTAGGGTLFASWCQTYDPIDRLRTSFNGTTVSGTGNGCTKPTTSTAINQVRALTGQLYDLGYDYSGDRLNRVVTPGSAITTNTTPAGTRRHAYNEASPHRTTNIANEGTGTSPGLPPSGSYSWDNQGRATAAPGGRTYGYDPQGQLTSSTKTSTSPVALDSSTYAYTADGLRFARRVGSNTTVWLGDVEITRDTATNNARISTSHHITTPGGVPVATRYGEVVVTTPGQPAPASSPAVGWNWAATDAQNTIRLTRQADGAYPSHHYLPYGEPNPNTSIGTAASFTYHPTDRGYLDKTHDKILGDIRLDHRTYTPNLNMLTAPDPLLDGADPLTLNPYSYARSNPFAYSDPSGLEPSPGHDGGTPGETGFDTPDNQVGPGASPVGNPELDPLLTMIENAETGDNRPDTLDQFAYELELVSQVFDAICNEDPLYCYERYPGGKEVFLLNFGVAHSGLADGLEVLAEDLRFLGAVATEVSGAGDAQRCFGSGSLGSCALLATVPIVPFRVLRGADGIRDVVRAADATDEAADIGHAGIHQFPKIKRGKSQFFDEIDLTSLTRTDQVQGFLQGNGNTRYLMRGRSDVGVDRDTGLPTSTYTVIRGPDGSVVTIFPGTSRRS